LNFHFIELCEKGSKTVKADAIGAWEEKVMVMTEIYNVCELYKRYHIGLSGHCDR